MKIILITSLFLSTLLQAKTFELSHYSNNNQALLTKPEPAYDKSTQDIHSGVALDIATNDSENFKIKVAYEGDFMIINDIINKENKIQKNNYYLGINYKF